MTRIDLAESAKSGKVEDAPPVFRAAGGEYCAAVNFDPAELRHVLRGREVEVLSALHIHPPQRGHMRCPRPDHEDVHPSWRWDHDKARWICTCGSGDVFDLVQALQGGGFPETIEFIASVLGLEPRRRPLRRQSPVEAPQDNRNGEAAHAIWTAALPAEWSPVRIYLQHRGIIIPPPPSIRFAELQHRTGQTLPTMVAAVQNKDGMVVAVLRTFLAPDGAEKAAVTPNKMALGPIAGGAARLALAADTVALVEGVEDGLALMQMTGTPVWAVLGTSGFLVVELPDHIHRVILAPDGDKAGDKVIDPAAERLTRQGIDVRVSQPPPGKDWCDILGTFEERAAFIEHEAGEDRDQAEREAWAEVFQGKMSL